MQKLCKLCAGDFADVSPRLALGASARAGTVAHHFGVFTKLNCEKTPRRRCDSKSHFDCSSGNKKEINLER